MKKIIFIGVLTCIYTTLIIHDTVCQSIANSVSSSVNAADPAIPEYNTALPVNTAKDHRNTIHIKAVQNFIQDFKEAKNVSWLRTNEDFYVARFLSDSIQTMVVYNQKGSWNYTLKKFPENKMSADLRKMVKSIYFDYTILEVSEIRQQPERENIVYNILITFRGNYKILQICNKEMEIVIDFTKP